jgi:pimeloyl-ACP methyl ester carboxylesterase
VPINSGGAEVTVDNILVLFFKESKTSSAAGHAYWDRIHERTKETSGEDRALYVSTGFADGGAGITALVEAMNRGNDIAFADEGSYNRLTDINIPVLVANGHEDIMVPTINSFVLAQKIPNAFLHIYPDSGHGFLFQYADLFAKQVNSFLDGW